MIRRFLARRRQKQALRAHHLAMLAEAVADVEATRDQLAALLARMPERAEAPERHDLRAHLDHHDPDALAQVPGCAGCVVRPGGAAAA